MKHLELDFVIYLGDPDEGAEAVDSRAALDGAETHADKLPFPDVYGALTVKRDGAEIVERKPDPIFSLITNLVRAVPYVIDGESERSLLTESEHGLSVEPSGDDVFVSFFAGDPYEPDDFLLEQTPMPLADFAEQTLSMGERLRDLIKKVSPSSFEDDYMKSLIEFLDVGRDAFKTFKLEVERGLRVT